ncbi:TetR family transcriptional regulator [Conexibacter sp. W3-3-2]|uniref:TetR/AcrR family transcriptional regulator n=1 Tax=Paraconexibacter algicola TaxID=2133960 RepID=A0A2T4UIX5_9ACTN|nr:MULTISPECIES: TetR/AcrR family transcriptional regulator [Solirubrobacterales]MTD45507.1 TetR family transcriptional regulator [Conexibacter sp. W3-3-2]PTL59192.1 TetR/AcrR family transcriptional regulator [Paraconexibacter algicola]
MANDASPPAPSDRRARRKAETRARLLDGARVVFARQGVDATRINEITEEADIGFGSFYNHFESKDAIVAALVEEQAVGLAAAIDAATEGVDDVAEIVSVAHRALIQHALRDTDLGWLLVRLEASHDVVSLALGPYAARDLERGIAAGRFAVDDAAIALVASGGALLATVRAALQGRFVGDVGVAHAAAVLRIFGVPASEAAEVASRPMPTVDAPAPSAGGPGRPVPGSPRSATPRG